MRWQWVKDSVKVKVKLFGPLAQHRPRGTTGPVAQVELDAGATVDDLAVQLGIEHVAAVVCVNDQETHRARSLKTGDVVSFFAPLAGG